MILRNAAIDGDLISKDLMFMSATLKLISPTLWTNNALYLPPNKVMDVEVTDENNWSLEIH